MSRVRRTREGVVLASVLLLVTSLSAVASVAARSAGAAASVLDNFECYTATSGPTAKVPAPFRAAPKKVALKNPFAYWRVRGLGRGRADALRPDAQDGAVGGAFGDLADHECEGAPVVLDDQAEGGAPACAVLRQEPVRRGRAEADRSSFAVPPVVGHHRPHP